MSKIDSGNESLISISSESNLDWEILLGSK